MPIPFSFPHLRGAVFLLGFPARPVPRRCPAWLAAIALARPPGMKASFASLEQTPAGSRMRSCLPAPEWRLIFAMACTILVRAHGRSLLPESSCPEEDGYPLRGALSIRLVRSQNSIATRACTTNRAGSIWKRSSKRGRALVETNSPANSRSQTHQQHDGTRGEADCGLPPALRSKTKSDC